MDDAELNKLTEKVIGCAFSVSNSLGAGFLEKVYENALAYELRKASLRVEQQKPINVYYEDIIVGEYTADLLIENYLLLELKTVEKFNEVHLAQSLNYLKATNLPLCLLLNFGKPKVEIKRVYLSTNIRNVFS